MSDLLKKLEAAELLAKEKADLCETLKASIETEKAQAVDLQTKLEAANVAITSGVAKAAELEKAIEAHKAELITVKAELETVKAKLAIAPGNDLGEGDKKPMGAGVAGDPVDHKAVYSKISDPMARAKYRAEFGKFL